jgi:hypothetical protein
MNKPNGFRLTYSQRRVLTGLKRNGPVIGFCEVARSAEGRGMDDQPDVTLLPKQCRLWPSVLRLNGSSPDARPRAPQAHRPQSQKLLLACRRRVTGRLSEIARNVMRL